MLILLQVYPAVQNIYGQSGYLPEYQYISPLPYSIGHNPETTITLRYGIELDKNSVNGKYFELQGELSGKHNITVRLASDNKSLLIIPDKHFNLNERIYIRMNEGIRTVNGLSLPVIDFWFRVKKSHEELQHKCEPCDNSILQNSPSLKSASEIPEVRIVKCEDPAPGNIYCTLKGSASSFLYAFDNYGTPVFYLEFPYLVSHLKPHPKGELTYHDYELDGFIELDSRYDPVDTFQMANGYMTNMHEFVLLDNGHALMLAYDYQQMDLSQIIENGDTSALVIGFIIQELDEQNNLLFQWRSWDHMEISDTYLKCEDDFLNRFTLFDYAHANSIDMDSDTSLIISTRNMSEITKVHRHTGKIIWRMGGKNNEFSFIDDPKAFRGQHTVKKQANGNITMLDNGYGSDSLYSRGIEYKVDEIQKTVLLVKEYIYDPSIYGYAMGNLQRLGNGNSLIYWGMYPSGLSTPVTEYNPEGRVVFESLFDKIQNPSYRCYRSEWIQDVFTLSNDSLNFVQTADDQHPARLIQIRNNTGRTLFINNLLSHTGYFSLNENLPLKLLGGESRMLELIFHTDSVGQYHDVLTFCYDTDTSRVSVQLSVLAETLVTADVPVDPVANPSIYPNPVNDLLEITSGRMITRLKIFDTHGRLIFLTEEPGMSYRISLEKVEGGLIILQLYYPDGATSRFKIIKI